MKCPVCTDVSLVMSERHGVEIDYCPNCRGVWLDRGELDKIVDRAEIPREQPHPPQQQPVCHGQNMYGHKSYGHYKKKKSLLSELFDFD